MDGHLSHWVCGVDVNVMGIYLCMYTYTYLNVWNGRAGVKPEAVHLVLRRAGLSSTTTTTTKKKSRQLQQRKLKRKRELFILLASFSGLSQLFSFSFFCPYQRICRWWGGTIDGLAVIWNGKTPPSHSWKTPNSRLKKWATKIIHILEPSAQISLPCPRCSPYPFSAPHLRNNPLYLQISLPIDQKTHLEIINYV